MQKFVFILPEDKRWMAESTLDAIRTSNYSLETAMEINTTALIKEHAETATQDSLIDGHTYAIFSFSPMATRIRGNKQTAYAGEVYLISLTWDAKVGQFYCRNAWGGINYYPVKSGMLLVE